MVAASCLGAVPAQAAPGDLDPTFSEDGKLTTDFGRDEGASGVVVQPDGKIVAASGGVVAGDDLARYNPEAA